MKSKPPKFTISILAMNGLEMTRACVDSVVNHSDNYELILTSNGATDGTDEYFASLGMGNSHITAVINPKNLGFIEPNISALARAKGEYFITLNNDSKVPPGWLVMMEAEFYANPTAAIVGADGACNGFADGAKFFLGAPTRRTEYIEGSCMMGRTAFLREIGLFSPFLKGAYAEDVDLSLRARSLGRTIHMAPFHISHKRSQSSNQVPELNEWQAHNHAYLVKRWGNYLKHRRLDLPIIVRRMGAIGDCILVTPLIRAIKQASPRSEIFVETDCPDVFKGNPNVAGVAKSWRQHYLWGHLIDLDMAYENMSETHIQEAYSSVSGFVIKDRKPELFPSVEDTELAKKWVGDGKWMAVHIGPSHWPGKHWPAERFSKVLGQLLKDGWHIILIGEKGSSVPCTADVRGLTTLHQSAAVIGKCAAFLGIDSSPLHMAQAMGVPAVALFGCTSPEYILSPGRAIAVKADPSIPCAGSRHRTKGRIDNPCAADCIESITVERVLNAMRQT